MGAFTNFSSDQYLVAKANVCSPAGRGSMGRLRALPIYLAPLAGSGRKVRAAQLPGEGELLPPPVTAVRSTKFSSPQPFPASRAKVASVSNRRVAATTARAREPDQARCLPECQANG